MTDGTTPTAPEPSPADLIGGLMADPVAAEPGFEPAPANPELMEELTGESLPPDPSVDPTGDTDGSDLHGPVPPEFMEKLRRAQADAGKAGERLGDERKTRERLEDELADLRAQVTALQNGQPAPTAQSYESPQPSLLGQDQVDGYVATLDPTYQDTRGEFITKEEAAQMAVNAAYHAAQAAMGQVGGVMGTVEQMKFDQELTALGTTRERFDAIWEDPAMGWGAGLSDDQKLAALKSQAMMTGSGPSAPVPTAPVGAPPTSRGVDPRRTIETNQGASSVQNPRRLATLGVDRALEAGDGPAAQRAATPLFAQLLGQPMLNG